MEISKLNLKELSINEQKEIEGGHPVVVVAAVVCTAVSLVVIGAVVGYGIYKLVDWATTSK
jgi:hypothetical protein